MTDRKLLDWLDANPTGNIWNLWSYSRSMHPARRGRRTAREQIAALIRLDRQSTAGKKMGPVKPTKKKSG